MTTANLLLTSLAALATIWVAVIGGVIGIWRISAAVTGLKKDLRDNIKATQDLTAESAAFRQDVTKILFSYGEWLNRLDRR